MKEIEKLIMEIVSQLHAPDHITPGTHWIGCSKVNYGVYPTTIILNVFARVSLINEGTRDINFGICIAASRPDRITPGTHWIRRWNDKNGANPTTKLLTGVARVSIQNEGTREINYGNCIAASRPDRFTPGTHW
jgi:hypothetical protein